MKRMAEIRQVNFGYTEKEQVLYQVTCSVEEGTCALLCGESGCGKTTVTKLVNGLIPHFADGCFLEGNVETAGMKVAQTELYQLAKKVGSVFQNPKSQFFHLDTDGEIAFGLENEGIPPEVMEKRVRQTVEQLHIEDLTGRNIFSLSGGEKQMLAFASVYAMEPVLYVLDEPTANLDEEGVRRLREQICLLKKQGRTVLIAEHRLYFLADLIDRAYYFRRGRLEEEMTGSQFRGLTGSRRRQMGLRSLTETALLLPPARESCCGAGLAVEGLSCGYRHGRTVIEGLTFAAVPGEVLAVTGANGVGKTTLIRCLCGLLKESAGRICLDGRAMTARQRQGVSFLVMQDVNHQLFYDSVEAECRQAAGRELPDLEEILERFDLCDCRDRHPMALSGGQKQRLAVAAAMVSGRRVLIFDEPTSGLDLKHMEEVSRTVRELADAGHIVMVVSHDREFMAAACDRVLRLSR